MSNDRPSTVPIARAEMGDSPAAGLQVLFPSEDLKDGVELVNKVAGAIAAILQFIPAAGQIAKVVAAGAAGLSAFLTGTSVLTHNSNTVFTVMPVDGPALFFAVVGDTGGNDISDDGNPKDDTRVVAVKMLDVELVMS